MFICIYSVRREIDQVSTKTSRYSTCYAVNIYIFVYIFIEAPLIPIVYISNLQMGCIVTLTLCILAGKHNTGGDPKELAKELRKLGFNIYVIGVSKTTNDKVRLVLFIPHTSTFDFTVNS